MPGGSRILRLRMGNARGSVADCKLFVVDILRAYVDSQFVVVWELIAAQGGQTSAF